MKKCTKCKEKREETEFYTNKRLKDGLHSWCKICCRKNVNKFQKENQSKNLNEYTTPSTKVCSKCKKERSAIDFGKSLRRKDGLQGWCKICKNKNNRHFTIKNGVSIHAKQCGINEDYRIKCLNSGWVGGLVYRGKLDHPTKYICGMKDCTNQAVEYHHLKYDGRSLEDPISIVAPLCKYCHSLFHIREREGIDLTNQILTQIELEYIPYKKPHIRFLKEKV